MRPGLRVRSTRLKVGESCDREGPKVKESCEGSNDRDQNVNIKTEAEPERKSNEISPPSSPTAVNEEQETNAIEEVDHSSAGPHTPSTALEETITDPGKKVKVRLGTVVVWGKLFEELTGAGKPDFREDTEQADGDSVRPSGRSGAEAENGQVDEENQNGDGDGLQGKRPYTRKSRMKRSPDLITRAEHMRILRSALRNTMQCKVREVLGEEAEISDPNDEISEAIRGAISTRKRRGRKSKRNGATPTDDVDANAAGSNLDENGENAVIPEDLDDDSKPRTTYHELIKIALEENPEGMTVSAIYNWLANRHPSFQLNDTRWKNSVRHNLSINPYFEKHTQPKSSGGGHIWKISEKYNNCSESSRPPPMKRLKSAGRPRRPDDDSEFLRRELNRVMQDAGLGNVKMEMGDERGPLMLPQDIQLYAIDGFEGHGDFDPNGNYGFGDMAFQSEEYASFMPFPIDGVSGEYFLVDQALDNLDVGNLSTLRIPENVFNPYLASMEDQTIATIDMSQLASGVHNINLEYQQHTHGEENGSENMPTCAAGAGDGA